MNWYKKSNVTEDRYLRDYLKEGFNPYDFSSYLMSFLEEFGLELGFESSGDEFEDAEQWISSASKGDISMFEKWIEEHVPDDTNSPGYRHLILPKLLKPTWLIHFTNDADSIEREGFKYGHDEFEGIGLTTWKDKKRRTEAPGYNFAFEARDRTASFAASKGKYGKEAVIFWSGGTKAYHVGDEEHQVIFYGNQVDKSMIFPIYRDGNGWRVSFGYRDILEDASFDNAVSWVIANYRMIQDIRKKSENKSKLKRRQI